MEKAKVKKVLALAVIALVAIIGAIVIQQLRFHRIYFLRDGVPLSHGKIEVLGGEAFTLDSDGMLDYRKTVGDDRQILFILRDSDGNRVVNSALTCPQLGNLIIDYCNNNRRIVSTKTFIIFDSLRISETTEQISIPDDYFIDESDADLKNLLKLHPDLPPAQLRKVDETTFKYPDGGEYRQVLFVLMDGLTAKKYPLTYKPDGTFNAFMMYECDAIEYYPEFRATFKEVDQRVSDELEHEKVSGLGTCHVFWERKKKYLKAKGIDWRSPQDISPDTCFD